MVIGLQTKIAEAAGVTVPYINRVVNFKQSIKTWKTAKKIAHLTNTCPSDWLEGRRDVIEAALEKLTIDDVQSNADAIPQTDNRSHCAA